MITIKFINNFFEIETNRIYKKFKDKEKITIFFLKSGYENFNLTKNEQFKINDFKKIKNFFLKSNIIDTILIFENNKVCLASAIDAQQFNIFNDKNFYFFSTDEFFLKKKICYDSIYLSLNTKYNFWLSGGINEVESIIPGTINLFDLKNLSKPLKTELIFDYLQFASNSSHQKIVNNLIEKFDNTFCELKKINATWELLLSSGLDSAIYLSFALRNNLKVNLNTFETDISEIDAASRFSKFYNIKLNKFRRGGIQFDEKFTINTNISNYLEFIKPILENYYSVMPLLNIVVDFAYYINNKNKFILEGSEYPRSLTIEHLTHYPNYFSSGFNKFNPKINSEKRLKILKNYKFDYETFIINKSEMINYLPGDIDERYFHTLSKVFYGTQGTDLMKSFVINKKILNDKNILKNSIKKNGIKIIDILNNINIFKELKNFSEKKNIMLHKTIRLITGTARSEAAKNQTNNTGLLHHFRPGTNSSIVNELLKTSYDSKLINFPKWHLFEIFKKTAGYDFFSLTYKSIFFQEYYKKILFKYKINRDNSKKILFLNKSFRLFVNKNYKDELQFVLHYLKLDHNLDNFFDEKIHFMTFSKIINLSALLKNNKIKI